ncbi:OmpA family protein [Saccharopolyspora pogona]|uniref:OmpA family protein n=1 Tax=Saccharopolyspora pogona TaxID=333966 RepID=UPI001682078A|nr:OmpA family protein [Saccharopolyspora pogona]
MPTFATVIPPRAGTVSYAVPSELFFESDTATPLAGAADRLRPVAEQLKRGASAKLIGHTARYGDRDGARTLSAERARAVARALVAAGAPPASITEVTGEGFDRPLRDSTDALAADAAQRCVEILITTQ